MSKPFSIRVYSVDTNEVFPVDNVTANMKVSSLKVKLELIAGIPTHLQRIMYLDQGDMEDNSTLKHHDVVSGARLTMHIWSSWSSLIRASAVGNIGKVMSLGVTIDSTFRNPNTEQMTTESRKEWFLARSAIALYVAAHRGHIDLMAALIKSGVDIAATTKNGRNALHVAAASGQDSCVDVLLANGAGKLINKEDYLGESPLKTAATWGHKSAERRLFLFQWRKRAVKMQTLSLAKHEDLMAHQLFDSTSRTWMRGANSQHYQSEILPPQEFQGTAINSKRSSILIKKDTKSEVDLKERKKFVNAKKQGENLPKIVVSDDAVLVKGIVKDKTAEEIFPSTKLTVLNDKSQSTLAANQANIEEEDEFYKSRRYAYLKKYKPEETITYHGKQAAFV